MKSWVIGGRGLLGSSVRDELLKSDVVWNQNMQIGWAKNNADSELESQKASIIAAVNEFASIVKDSNWAIYWCAGIGVVSSPSEILRIEEIAMINLLDALMESNPLVLARGRIFYASSAGGVYADSVNPPFNEETSTNPVSPYGFHKIYMESLLTSFGVESGTAIIRGRVANLYGVGQNSSKQQGLITTLVRRAMLNQTLNIYVPLQTTRNYIYTTDAARQIVSLTECSEKENEVVIVGSSNNWSISSILKMTQEVTKKKLKISLSSNAMTKHQPIDLRLESLVSKTEISNREVPFTIAVNYIKHGIMSQIREGSAR